MAGSKSSTFTTAITVKLDPKFEIPPVVLPYKNDSGDPNSTPTEASSGMRQPFVYLNKRIIFGFNIKYIKLDFTGRYPEGQIVITDGTQRIEQSDNIGPNNRIILGIVPATNETYKKIKIPGYITDTYKNGPNETVYNFIFKYMPLEKPLVKSYPFSNTYEFFQKIAEETQLGFAVSEQVESVQDCHYRLLQGNTLKQAMEEQVRFAGTDEKSIFDFWVDPWGYINLVNLSYLTSEIDLNVDLKVEVGHKSETEDMQSPIESVQLSDKTNTSQNFAFITNMAMQAETNIHIKSWRRTVDNSRTVLRGNSVQYQSYGIEGTEGGNNETTQTDVMTSSPDISSENVMDCEFMQFKFQGTEMDDIPVLKQQAFHDNFMNKFNQGTLQVEMSKPNFGLSRGSQILVTIIDYSKKFSAKYNHDTEDNLEHVTDQGVLDPTVSGTYYIQGITYEFIQGQKEVKQTLTLIQLMPSASHMDVVNKYVEGTNKPEETTVGEGTTDLQGTTADSLQVDKNEAPQ